jgi:hypothetical protein
VNAIRVEHFLFICSGKLLTSRFYPSPITNPPIVAWDEDVELGVASASLEVWH